MYNTFIVPRTYANMDDVCTVPTRKSSFSGSYALNWQRIFATSLLPAHFAHFDHAVAEHSGFLSMEIYARVPVEGL
jgi:hypothetical protein